MKARPALLVLTSALAATLAVAQQTGGAPTGVGNTGVGNSGTGGNAGRGNTTTTTTTPTNPQNPNRETQPIFITGRVVLDDGAIPPERVSIERVCSNSVYREGYTDSKGYFSVQLGANNGVFADASLDTPIMFGNNSSLAQQSGNQSLPGGMSTALWGCELRATLTGFHSDSIQLGNRRALDNPDIGTIFLTRMVKVDGYTTSATIALAPKDAKKAYEKGLNFVKRSKPDAAQAEFLRAVKLYPRHAGAWFELGKVYELRNHMEEARDAYRKATGADANYVNPYEKLYLLAMRDSQWKDAAELSDKVLRLNPYEFPQAYYANAVSNAQLQNWDAAEKSAREASKLRGTRAMPRSLFVLGVALANKGDLTGSAATLRNFLSTDPVQADRERVQKMLSQIDQETQAKQPSSKE